MTDALNSDNQLSRLRAIAEPVCAAHGVALVDARFHNEVGLVLKVLIERVGAGLDTGAGVTLDDCQQVSRDLSTALDVHEGAVPASAYRLEVGSPGLDRPLFSIEDFARFAGQEVKVQTKRPVGVEPRKRFRGTLLGIEGRDVKVIQDGTTVLIPHAEISKANVVYRF